MIGLRVDELPHHPNLGIGFGAVGVVVADILPVPAVVAIGIDLGAVVDVDLLCGYAGGMDELHLLGFAITQSGAAFERVEVVFIKGLLGNRWTDGGGRIREGL